MIYEVLALCGSVFTKYCEEILFMSSINFLLFPDATWPVIGEGISYHRSLTPLLTRSNNERDKKVLKNWPMKSA